MGVKSSIIYTREQAENAYVQLRLDEKRAKYERKVKKLSDKQLEDWLDTLADDKYNRENNVTTGGYDNYVIERT